MNIKKPFLLISLMPLLFSCSKPKYVGEYVFQLGKSKDTHMNVSLQLTKDVFDAEKPDLGKKFTLTFDSLSSDSGSETDIMSILNDLGPITGHYHVDPKVQVYDASRLFLGLYVLGEYDIPQEITELLFVANIDKTSVNFYLPVSLNDLKFQLYWYGYDLNIAALFDEDPDEDPLKTKEGAHEVGTHPTQEDIDRINTHYIDDHGVAFRDYHVLQLGLTKQ